MDATAAKTEQATAKRLFTMANNQLAKSINDESSTGTIRSKFQALSTRMDEVMNKHASYLALSHPDESEPTGEETQWLQEIEERFTEAEESYERYEASLEPKSPKSGPPGDKTFSSELKKKTRLCQFEMDSVDAMLSGLKITVEDETASVQSIKDAQADLKNQMEQYRSTQRDLILILDSEEDLQKITVSMQKLQRECAKLNIVAGKAIESRTVASAGKKLPQQGIDLKMERMKMPAFSGNIRDYPRFKADFTKHVMPITKSDDSAAYLLKSCLEKDPLDTVKNVDDNLSEMWVRLDDRYGRS